MTTCCHHLMLCPKTDLNGMDVGLAVLPKYCLLWHQSREVIGLHGRVQADTQLGDFHAGRSSRPGRFYWLCEESGIQRLSVFRFDNIQRYQLRGEADYVGQVSASLRYDLLLLDLLDKGAKEGLLQTLLGLDSEVNVASLCNQTTLAEHVSDQGFDGWISCQDRNDDRLEVYIYNYSEAVIVRERIIYGP